MIWILLICIFGCGLELWHHAKWREEDPEDYAAFWRTDGDLEFYAEWDDDSNTN